MRDFINKALSVIKRIASFVSTSIKKIGWTTGIALEVVNFVSRRIPHPVARVIAVCTSMVLLLTAIRGIWCSITDPTWFDVEVPEWALRRAAAAGVAKRGYSKDSDNYDIELELELEDLQESLPEIQEFLKPIMKVLKVAFVVIAVIEMQAYIGTF